MKPVRGGNPGRDKCSVYRVKNGGLERNRLRLANRERDERHDDPWRNVAVN